MRRYGEIWGDMGRHGEHVELDEADEAARRLDRDGLHLAHLDAEYLPGSLQISPISRTSRT